MRKVIRTLHVFTALATAASAPPAARAAAEGPVNVPPQGFVSLFNGRDLSGWRGLGQVSPYEIAKWNPQQRTDRQRADDEDMKKHWRVETGEIVNDGHGVFLTTVKDYGDIELLVDWKMPAAGTDSGIYLRACPQVQIWDPADRGQGPNGADKGSGALWNNNAPPGKFPLVKADNPVGQWNTFRIIMIGSRVTVYLNDKLTVDHAVMENYWDRARPIPASGPLQLQTHGGEMRFRNLFIHEIPDGEANRILQRHGEDGFEPIFNGKDLTGWTDASGSCVVRNGTLAFKPGAAGTLFSEKEYGDFAVRFEFKLPPAGNNGLAIRAPLEGNPAFAGMEIQILDDTAPKYADIKDWQCHGSVYGLVPAHRGYLRPVGQWSFEEVIIKGSHIEVVLNGTTILDADLSRIKEPPDGRDHPGLLRTTGRIGFMGHGDPVEFRNIRLKVLK